jgi:hypothetical protein
MGFKKFLDVNGLQVFHENLAKLVLSEVVDALHVLNK